MSVYEHENKRYYNFGGKEVVFNGAKVNGMVVEYDTENDAVLLKTFPAAKSLSPLEMKAASTNRTVMKWGCTLAFLSGVMWWAGNIGYWGGRAYENHSHRKAQQEEQISKEQETKFEPFTFTYETREGVDDYRYTVQKGDTATHITQQFDQVASQHRPNVCYFPIELSDIVFADGKPVGDRIKVGEELHIYAHATGCW